jgi:neutral ceramidase
MYHPLTRKLRLGLEIKRRSPFRDTLIITLANDMDFYVPTGKAFAEGSYEIVTSPLISGGGETLVDAAVGLLKDLSVQRAGAQLGSH